MSAYSTRQVAELVGASQQGVRSAARAGLVSAHKTPKGHYRFSFQDIVLLRTTTLLKAGKLAPRRLWRALRALRSHLPPEQPLCSVRVCSVDDRILIREANSAWEVESGQAVFEFSGPGTGDNVAANAGSTHAAKVVNAGTAEYWFDRGLGCDQSDAYDNAAACYRRALKLDPEHINSHINLGRIRHAARAYAEAEGLYRSALALEPGNAIAAFNIGVALEDQGRLDEALDLYRRAARSDPNLPDAHYNLARLLELRGDKKKASHHLRRFYALTGNNSD